MPTTVLAQKGVMGGVLHMLKYGCQFAFLHQAWLCRAHTSCVNHFRPQYYTF